MGLREFPAVISKVEDGDTVYVWCDQGFDNWRYTKVRIRGIATRELSMVGGKEARDFLSGLLPDPSRQELGATCVVYSYKWDKYAPRVDGDIMLNGRLISELMIDSGHAAFWDGKGKQPIPTWPIPLEIVEGGTVFVP